jgi:uncharacterized protein DUF2793
MACSRPVGDILLLRPNLILTARLSRILPASRIFLEAQMDQSPRLSLSYLMPAQAQKHVTVNETFRRLDQLVQQTVLSRTLAAEPGAPNDGDAYILPASPTGATWATFAQNNVAAYQDGAWIEISAAEGFSAWVADTDEFIIYDGSSWTQVAQASPTQFGVNTTADTTNKLTVKSNAVLFDALDAGEGGTGDSQVKVNKEAVGDTASHLFQTGFSGRAEFGLTGDDDFHVKVSADGSAWTEALFIDKDNGDIGVGITGPATKLHVSIDGATPAAVLLSSADEIVLSALNAAPGFAGIVAGSSSSNRMVFKGVRARGTLPSPTAVQSGDETFSLLGAGYDGTNDKGTAAISFSIDAAVSTGVVPQQIVLQTGTTSRSTRVTIGSDGSVTVGSPTGGGKGAGTINANAVYDDNTMLTCYVFDQALDGAIDDAKWDGKVPDRIISEEIEAIEETGKQRIIKPEQTIVRTHEPMRKFRARIGTVEDPLTLDGYAKHWREKRHLTSMPNEATFDPANGLSSGEWVQRLVETVEIQAVLIEELNQRVKVLETAKLAR